MKNVKWYFDRLSKMESAEVLHRVKHLYFSTEDKVRYANEPPEIPEFFRNNDILRFHQLTPRLFEIEANEVEAIINEAEKIYSHHWNIFGIPYNPGPQIDWHKCPKTGNNWPLKYWWEVPIRDGFSIGGVKFIWEVNRLYFLPILGIAYDLTGLNKYGDKIFALLSSWLNANQYPLGVNWTSGIELSVRVANLCWALSFLKDYQLSSEQVKLLNDFFWLHGRHLYRYQSKYSSNNNHAIAEAFGLFLIGAFSSPIPETVKWFSFGKQVLERECGRQLLPDGGSYEYATTYLSFVFDFFLLFKLICERLEIAYSPVVELRLASCCSYIYSLMDRKGNFPNIGDQDSAVLINFGLNNHENLKSILNTGSVLFKKQHYLTDTFPDLKTRLLLGEEKFNSVEFYPEKVVTSTAPTTQIRLLKHSGLGVIRRKDKDGEVVFVGNATPLGMPPLYAHGHLDALSFYLSVDGREIFVDPGTYLYHSGGKWRRYFRSTAAHNTLRINGQDFTSMPGDFMFGRPYTITHHSLVREAGSTKWCAEHDAYQRLTSPVKHRRTVEWQDETLHLDIIDAVATERDCFVELFFHLHPHCVVTLDGQQAIIENDGIKVVLDIMKSLEIEVFRGSEKPVLGWFSREFNHLEKTITLVCRQNLRGNIELRNSISIFRG